MLELLKRVGWTQTELAKRLSTSTVTVNIWCNKNRDSVAYRAVKLYLELLARTMGK